MNLKSGEEPVTVRINFEGESYSEINDYAWLDTNRILVRLMNRNRNGQKIYVLSIQDDFSYKTVLVREELNADEGWYRTPPASSEGEETTFYIIPPSPQNGRNDYSYIEIMNKNGFAHLAFFSNVNASSPTSWLTAGEFNVLSLNGYNAQRDIVYYSSNERGASQVHVYSVVLSSLRKASIVPHESIKILSMIPSLNYKLGSDVTEIGVWEVIFSSECNYFQATYLGPDVPFSYISSLDNPDFLIKSGLEGEIVNNYGKYAFPKTTYFHVKNDEGEG